MGVSSGYNNGDVESASHPGQGTLVIDSYEEEEAYDYQYEEYDSGIAASGSRGMLDENADVDSIIQSKMKKTESGEWQCCDCYKTSRVKTNILEHIEASHVETPGYNCDICFKYYKNRHSLRNHRNLKHKDMKYV